MFEVIITAIKEFDAKYRVAYDMYKENEKKCIENYVGALLTEKVNEAKTAYLETVAAARSEATAAADKVFADIANKVSESASSVNQELFQLVDTVKVMGKHLTQSEAKIFMDKVKGNYIASSALRAVLVDNGIIEANNESFAVESYDSIMERIEDLHEIVLGAINEQAPESYKAKLVYVRENNPLRIFERDHLNPFINR